MHAPTSEYVPGSLDASDWSAVEPLAQGLLDRPVETADELERWLIDRSEFEAAILEAQANLYIAMTCDTDSEEANDGYSRFVEEIPPKLKPFLFEMDKRYVALADTIRLDSDRYAVLDRSSKSSVELFREKNIPIQTELAKLSQEFGKIAGGLTVEFDGETRTMPQMGRYLEMTDRDTRERAWRAVSDRRMREQGTLNDLLSSMVEKRHAVATNAGHDSYVSYTFQAKERFDYTPADCRAFWDACEKHIVPLKRRLDQERREQLGVDTLRPWDLAVDPHGREPLRPFDGGRDLLDKTVLAIERLDPRLADLLRRLDLEPGASDNGAVRTHALDLDTRPAKRPGGYQYERPRSRSPFIFMNAAGLQRDVITMIHEAGHAFHSMLCADEPLFCYRNYPIEFAEVASMTMEHLTRPHWGGDGGFYAEPEALARAQREHIEDAVTLLAWIASIDAFQHWMYANPTHTADEREATWLELDQRFGHDVDWTGLDAERAAFWQKQSHIFGHPMYYIEYGIAQLGALQLWLRSRNESPAAAIDDYVGALSLGGAKPLPALFQRAGITFDFGDEIIGRLVDAVEDELAAIPT